MITLLSTSGSQISSREKYTNDSPRNVVNAGRKKEEIEKVTMAVLCNYATGVTYHSNNRGCRQNDFTPATLYQYFQRCRLHNRTRVAN